MIRILLAGLLLRPWLCLTLAVACAAGGFILQKTGGGYEEVAMGNVEHSPPPDGKKPRSKYGLPAMDADQSVQTRWGQEALGAADEYDAYRTLCFVLAGLLTCMALAGGALAVWRAKHPPAREAEFPSPTKARPCASA